MASWAMSLKYSAIDDGAAGGEGAASCKGRVSVVGYERISSGGMVLFTVAFEFAGPATPGKTTDAA